MEKGVKAAVAVMAVMVMCMMGCKKGQEAVYFPGFGDNGEYYAWPEAAKNFDTPKDNEGYLARAVAYIKAGKPEKAVEDCELLYGKLLMEGERKGEWEDVNEMMGLMKGTLAWAYANKGDYKEAIQEIYELRDPFKRETGIELAWRSFVNGNIAMLQFQNADESKKKMYENLAKMDFESAIRGDARYREMVAKEFLPDK